MKAWKVFLIAAALVLGVGAPAWALDANGPAWAPRVTVTGTMANEFRQDGSDRALAFDHYGCPGIAFFDDVGDDLRYARRVPGVGWVHSTVDTAGTVGWYPSLAYDRHESPGIAYLDGNLCLKFAYLSGSNWSVQSLSSVASSAAFPHLAFDLHGRPAIAYFDATNTALKYVEDTDGDMRLDDETPVTVSNVLSEGRYPSMVFDRLNRPMIAHQEDGNLDLWFSVREPGVGWVSTCVDTPGNTGFYPSIAINPRTGYPAISYTSNTSSLAYADWDGNSWHITTIDIGYFTSLAFDPADGNPAISYFSIYNSDLKLAWFDGNSWHKQIVDANGSVGWNSSLAFNDYGTGWPAIAYFDGGTGLYYIEDPPDVPEPACVALLLGGSMAWLLGRARMGRARRGLPVRRIGS